MYLIARDTYNISPREGDDRRSHPGPLRENVTICPRRREVKSALCVSTDRPTKMKFRVSDSAHPTDRPAARSAAKNFLDRNTRPTDPLGPRQSRSGATFGHFRRIPASLRVGTTDRPTRIRPTQASRVFRPTDPLRGRSDTQSALLTSLRPLD